MRQVRGESAARTAVAREDGQTLVEYALIIAVVSLGSLVALGFLSGTIQDLFSKTGSSINGVQVAAPSGNGNGGGNGGGTSTDPVDGDITTNPGFTTGGIPTGGGVWAASIQSNPGIDPGQGVLTNSPPIEVGCTVQGVTPNQFSFTGQWAPDPPNGNNDNPIWQAGGGGPTYHWACLATSAFSAPAPTTSFDSYKEFDDDRVDSGTFVFNPSNLNWHGSSAPNPGTTGVFRTGGSTGTGRAFFYTETGIYVCTWQTTPTSGNNNHWNTSGAGHSFFEGGTTYTQRCA